MTEVSIKNPWAGQSTITYNPISKPYRHVTEMNSAKEKLIPIMGDPKIVSEIKTLKETMERYQVVRVKHT